MKNLIASVLITISSVVMAQNAKVNKQAIINKQNTKILSENSYTVGSRNGTHITTDKKTHCFIIMKAHPINTHKGYKNMCMGAQAGKKIKHKITPIKRGYLIGYIGQDSLGRPFVGGYDTLLTAYPNAEKMREGIMKKNKLEKCFIISVTAYSEKERELFWKTKTK